MDEATLDRALGHLPLALTPTTPQQLATLAQAVDETAQELLGLSDRMDGTSSRLALIASALTGTATAARRMAQLATDEARAQMSTRERLVDSASEATDGLSREGIREDAGGRASDVALLNSIEDPSGDHCGECGSLLPADGLGWLCAPCELEASAAETEGASAASAGPAGPTPLANFEVLP
ncbi:hypothetical protein LCGC14_0996880 [marine sediment metagenome]|uniref:Uncharacterized protein n=1 Tax=marine sediment metagenome TaxID=412755 RepID=A0A0F9N8V5_9ZZZZ